MGDSFAQGLDWIAGPVADQLGAVGPEPHSQLPVQQTQCPDMEIQVAALAMQEGPLVREAWGNPAQQLLASVMGVVRPARWVLIRVAPYGEK